MDIESAQKTGAVMLFGEKYGETGACSTSAPAANCAEARTCSARATLACSRWWWARAAAAGVRRIEAVTGMNALAYLGPGRHREPGRQHPRPVSEIMADIGQALDNARVLEKEVAAPQAAGFQPG